MGEKFLIINADDFGMSHEFNCAIRDLLKNKNISTTSLMANGLAFQEAVDITSADNLQDVGVHLTLTRDSFDVDSPLIYEPLSGGKSLVKNAGGGLWQSADELKQNAKLDEIVCEIEMQIQKVFNAGINYTHIDNHMYSLMPRMEYEGYKAFFKAYRDIYNKHNRRLGFRMAKSFYNESGFNYIWSGRKIKPYINFNMKLLGLIGVDYCFAFPYYAERYASLESKVSLFDVFLTNLKKGVTELHVHPCIYSENLKKYNPTWQNRVHEYEMLKMFDSKQLKEKYGVTLIAYRDLIGEGMR